MNILFDGRPIRSPISGVARYCIELANSISNVGVLENINVTLYCQDWNKKNVDLKDIALDLVPLLHIDRSIPPKIKNILWEYLPQFTHNIEFKNRYDIIHESYFAGLGEAHWTGFHSKKVSTIHDVIPIDHPEWYNFSNRYFAKRNLARQCEKSDHIICVSEYTKRRVLELYPKTCELSVLPLGVSVPNCQIDMSLLDELNIEQESYIFYVGNIEPRKNLLNYVMSIKEVLIQNKGLKFIIAGHANYLATKILEPIIEEFSGQVVYLGKIKESLKWTLLRCAKLVVLPSLYEGFGIPVIEAYSVGTPIIFSDNSSLSELALNPDHIFDAEDFKDMRRVTENVLCSSEFRSELASSGLLYADKFQWDAVASETLDIYRSLV